MSDIYDKYNNEIYEKYNAILISLSDYKMVHRTLVEFICNCGTKTKIQYRLILARGVYCRDCSYKNSCIKRVNTVQNQTIDIKYSKVKITLNEIIKKDLCEILNINEQLTFKSIIHFRCNCGIIDSTLYRNIKIRGGICRKCCNTIADSNRTQTFRDKYGTTHASNTPHIIEKTKNTNLERYGTIYPAQSRLINSNTFKSKKYITPNQNEYIIQGYEDLALDELYLINDENNVIIGKKNVPRVNYLFNNKSKMYYPDIFLPLQNRIIEVKSTWTYKVQLDKNILKAEQCKNLGYKFEFWIYDIKKNKEIIRYY